MRAGPSSIDGQRTFLIGGEPSVSLGVAYAKSVQCSAGEKGPKKPHPFWYYIQDWSANGGPIVKRDYSGRFDWSFSGAFTDTSDRPSIIWPESDFLYNQALKKLGEKARGDLDLGQDIAEIPSTMKMIQTMGQFREMFGSRTFVGMLANNYLKTIFGVMPLLNSFYETSAELIRTAETRTRIIRGRASTRESVSFPENLRFHGERYIANTVSNSSVRCEVGVCLKVPSGYAQQMARFSSLNPVSIAWQLAPYSFVADWFVDVGGYLRSFENSFLYRNDVAWGWRTDTSLGTASRHLPPGSASTTASNLVIEGSGSMHNRFRSMTRTIFSSWPAPELPSFRVNLGSGQVLSLGALAAQRLSR